MKIRLRNIFILVLLSILLVSALPVQGTSTGGDGQLIRVGLYYANDALTYANLENSTGYGQGYRFGYFADDLSFVELARTDSSTTKVTTIRTVNYYRSGSDYSMTDNGGSPIGCYHIVVDSDLSDYSEANQLAAQYDDGFVAWIKGSYEVRVGTYLSYNDATADQANRSLEGTIQGTSSYAMNVLATGTNQILFQYDGGTDCALAIYPDVTGAEELRTWFKGYRYDGAFRYARVDGGNISVTNVVDLETYIKGVVPYEMSNSWPLEALKVQAICARTYAQIGINSSKHKTFDLCNTTCCQVYRGLGSASSSYQATAVTNQAVEETAGEFLWYNGELVKTYYSSSHGGASENISNVWGGNSESTPFLWGVIDPYEELIADMNSYSSWTRTYTSDQILTMLQKFGYGIGTSLDGIEAVYSPTGNVIQLIFHYTNGKTSTFSPDNMRSSSRLALPSIHFHINDAMVEIEEEETTTAAPPTANDGATLAGRDDLFTIGGNNSKHKLNTNNDVYVLTGDGSTELLDFNATESNKQPDTNVDLSGSVYIQDSTYVFNGAGWGHSIGMSQWGAYAMADKVGMTYDEIVTFYFPGTYVSTTG